MVIHRMRTASAMHVDEICIRVEKRNHGIHEGWASCLSYEHCGHGRCGEHAWRELTFIRKVKQKVPGCSRKAEFGQAGCRLSSHLQTIPTAIIPWGAIALARSKQLHAETGRAVANIL